MGCLLREQAEAWAVLSVQEAFVTPVSLIDVQSQPQSQPATSHVIDDRVTRVVNAVAAEPAVDEVGASTRQGANPARVTAFKEKATVGREEYFNRAYGSDQIFLMILATLPAYRGQGFGSALCRSGISRARDDDVVVTLYASPMGFQLYRGLGFQDLGDIIVRAPGEEESIAPKAMVYTLERKQAVRAEPM